MSLPTLSRALLRRTLPTGTPPPLLRPLRHSRPSPRALSTPPPSNLSRAESYLSQHPPSSSSSSPLPTPPKKVLPQIRGDQPAPGDILALLTDAGGLDVAAIDVARKAAFTDTLIVATGHTPAHLAAMAETLVADLRARRVTLDGAAPALSTAASPDWLVVDAGRVVVHFFLAHTRAEYALEELWGE